MQLEPNIGIKEILPKTLILVILCMWSSMALNLYFSEHKSTKTKVGSQDKAIMQRVSADLPSHSIRRSTHTHSASPRSHLKYQFCT